MTTEEIWSYAEKIGHKTKGKTPWATISAKIYVNMRDMPDSSPFIKIDSKPKKFFLKSLEHTISVLHVSEEVEKPQKTKYLERELHPFLVYYANTYMNIYTKTIFHEKSSKKSYTQWLHPDLVGVSFPINEWETETLNLGISLGSQPVKLYSFEMKKEITFANLRESFFQSVSNSSWANEGYLVAAKISEDEEFINELGRLTSAFGIGIIKIDTEYPDASETLFPAKYKPDLDWETINKLCRENPDFKNFTVRVKNDLSSKEIITTLYDKIYDPEKLVSMINTSK
jgi:uncharacterized protein